MHHLVKRAPAIAVCAALLLPVAGNAQTAGPTVTGPWHYRSFACVDTTVSSVMPRLTSNDQRSFAKSEFVNYGVVVTFKSHLGMSPVFPTGFAAVTHYQGEATNAVMIAEHPGDRVQVCYLGPPTPDASCNPDTDSRGRKYRVYDYKQHASYDGINTEHDCGGA